jgi:2'-5' RNA ligase
MNAVESALVVLAPEAEPWVKPYRDRYDPSARIGVPAHVTLLYPFRPPSEIDPAVLEALRSLFAAVGAFAYDLVELRRFPNVVYLRPAPDDPFRAMTQAVFARFPETPPYGGAFAEVIPHLTLAQCPEPETLDQVADGFSRTAAGQLPIRALVSEVALMDNTQGTWQVRATFPLRQPH